MFLVSDTFRTVSHKKSRIFIMIRECVCTKAVNERLNVTESSSEQFSMKNMLGIMQQLLLAFGRSSVRKD